MDWLSIAKALAPIAPTVLGFAGGFIPVPGASVAMSLLGKAIARIAGVPETPESVNAVAQAAASGDQVRLAQINAALEETKARWAAGTEQEKAWAHVLETGVVAVNETIRAEIRPENRHWFFTGWRPACGWVLVIHAFVFGCMLAIATFRAAFLDNPTPLNSLSEAWKIYLAYFGALAAVVGVAIFARSEDKKRGVDTSTVQAKPASPVKPAPTPVAKPAIIGKPVGSRD